MEKQIKRNQIKEKLIKTRKHHRFLKVKLEPRQNGKRDDSDEMKQRGELFEFVKLWRCEIPHIPKICRDGKTIRG